MRVVLLLAVFAVAVPVREDIAPKQTTPEDQLLGTWQVVGMMFNDTLVPQDKDEMSITFTRTEVHSMKNGKRTPNDDASYTVDRSKMPAAIDLTPKGKEPKVSGIFKVEGDRLTICFSLDGKGPRPTDFTVRPNSQTAMLELKRMTK